ncbi:hypothetical protein [Hespellia stercorisuis]|uniref:Uncharacterized protein n=1 Tax=Hespellia stercorisuis DSM 15480 TaxID=1121950 RepID=A0A1M6TBK2_9FIRM|nr:hypothetical protein [Hespellia stercorisuis]SHK54432.1 hypothetical protein SAMN02745243_03187 [Hespellia stercorisuis DSM 15480]
MDWNSDEFKQYLYDAITGNLAQTEKVASAQEVIKNEFASGALCNRLYQEVYQSNQNLCERLGTDEDKDVELIISNLFQIAEHLSKRMYDYGAAFSNVLKK